jgi:2-methylcitrate dehydratase
MAYIISSILSNALKNHQSLQSVERIEDLWKQCMLTPYDYGYEALFNPVTRELMSKIEFEHGGKEYDDKYPEGIPTSIEVTMNNEEKHDSGFVMFPGGHARNTDCNLNEIL